MIRLHLVVEGQTEETFVNQVLCPYLADYSVITDARCVLTSRSRGRQFKGGGRQYQKIRNDLLRWILEDQQADARFSTMFDFYALPADFPGYDRIAGLTDPARKLDWLEHCWKDDVGDPRFLPYLQLHEFEALLFADIQQLISEFPSAKTAVHQLSSEAAGFDSPELIDDGPVTAPSKRIIRAIPQYGGLKVSAGPATAARIGLTRIRERCPRFHNWLTQLEQLSA